MRVDDGYTIERHLSDHRPPYTAAELAKIRVPALFIGCREDAVTPLAGAKRSRLPFPLRA